MNDVIDPARWSATAQMFGARFDGMIDQLRQEIETRIGALEGDRTTREAISFQAHAISSFAGNFGCVGLYAASRALQALARTGDGDLGAPIDEVRVAADSTIAFLAAARSGASAQQKGRAP